MKSNRLPIATLLLVVMMVLWIYNDHETSFMARIPDYSAMADSGAEHESASSTVNVEPRRMKFVKWQRPFDYRSLYFLIPISSVLCLIIAAGLKLSRPAKEKGQIQRNAQDNHKQEEPTPNPLLNETAKDLGIDLFIGENRGSPELNRQLAQAETVEDDGAFDIHVDKQED